MSLSTPILSKEDTMLSTGNKVQINDIISKLENRNYSSKFAVTFSEDILVQAELFVLLTVYVFRQG